MTQSKKATHSLVIIFCSFVLLLFAQIFLILLFAHLLYALALTIPAALLLSLYLKRFFITVNGTPHKQKQEQKNAVQNIEDFLRLQKNVENESSMTQVSAQALKFLYRANLSTGMPVVAPVWTLDNDYKSDFQQDLRGEEGKKYFEELLIHVSKELNDLIKKTDLGTNDLEIIEFQLAIIQDETMIRDINTSLDDGLYLNDAIINAFDSIIQKLKAHESDYLRARVVDFLDLQKQLLRGIESKENPNNYLLAKNKIVFCRTLYPSTLLHLKNVGIKGIVSREGTSSSHTQILLESMQLPSLCGIDDLPMHRLDGKNVLLDPVKLELIIEPSEITTEKALTLYLKEQERVIQNLVELDNGEPFQIDATVNNPHSETDNALNGGADGIGLLRTEMEFIEAKTLPTEESLFESYRKLVKAFAGKPINIRMLDIGSDKLSNLIENDLNEQNPSMGQRSMRLLLKHKDIFRLQLRAILKASYKHEDVSLIYPLISSMDEWFEIKEFVKNIESELIGEGFVLPKIKHGIMVEVPSVVMRFEDYVTEFDIFNIGTNDLTQYTLAADRNNQSISHYYKAWHPSILTMIQTLIKHCNEHKKEILICGQIANDTNYLPLLIGLGIRRISVAPSAIPHLKNMIPTWDTNKCQTLAQNALSAHSIAEVEELIVQFKNKKAANNN